MDKSKQEISGQAYQDLEQLEKMSLSEAKSYLSVLSEDRKVAIVELIGQIRAGVQKVSKPDFSNEDIDQMFKAINTGPFEQRPARENLKKLDISNIDNLLSGLGQ